MSIDDILGQYKNFLFLRETSDEDIWVFYVIRDFSDPESIWMDSVYGFHTRGVREKDGKLVDVYAINLTACYNWEKGYYSIRCLIGTVLHELLHKYIHDEEQVDTLVKKLTKGYKYSRIYLNDE